MNVFVTVYVALLFMVLTPGVLLTIPKRGSKLVVAAVHGIVFAVIYHFTHKIVWKLSMQLDSFQNTAPKMPTTTGYNPTGYPTTKGYMPPGTQPGMKPGPPPPEYACKPIENNIKGIDNIIETIEKNLQEKNDRKRKMKGELEQCYKKHTR